MRTRKKNKHRTVRPFRFFPILLIAAAIAESVHAPFIQHSSASVPKHGAGNPVTADATSPPGSEPKKPGTWTVDPVPSSDDDRSKSKAIDQALDALSLPAPDAPAPANLLPAVPDGPSSLNSVGELPSTGGLDPFLQLPPTNLHPRTEYGFSGVVVPNGLVNNGPIARGRVGQNGLVTTTVAAVPEPGSVMIMAVGALGLLRRRSRSL